MNSNIDKIARHERQLALYRQMNELGDAKFENESRRLAKLSLRWVW